MRLYNLVSLKTLLWSSYTTLPPSPIKISVNYASRSSFWNFSCVFLKIDQNRTANISPSVTSTMVFRYVDHIHALVENWIVYGLNSPLTASAYICFSRYISTGLLPFSVSFFLLLFLLLWLYPSSKTPFGLRIIYKFIDL